MYCENCGKWLNEGEKCDCRKKKKIRPQKSKAIRHTRIKFNGKTLLSIVFLLIGSAGCYYFQYIKENVLSLTRIKLLQEYREYLAYGIPAILFLFGIIIGVLAVRKRRLKILSKMATFLNLAGLITMCALIGVISFRHYTVLQLISKELTEENCEKIKNAYLDAGENDSIRMRITDKLIEESNAIGDSFNIGEITYDEASQRLENISSMGIISEDMTETKQKLEELKQSKDSFENAEILTEDKTSLLQAAKLYAEVSENDKNYEEAQGKIEELQQTVTDIVEKGFSEDNQEILLALYADADNDLKAQIEQKAREELLNLKESFKNENVEYEGIADKLTIFNQIASLKEEVTEAEEYIEALNESRTAYQNAQELEKNRDTIMDAIVAYQQVIEDDSNYQMAQTKAAELIKDVSTQSKEEAQKMMEENQYEEAISLINVCIENTPDDSEFQEMLTKCKTQYTAYAVQTADQLLAEKKYDEAKAVLSKAYVATENQELQEKLNGVDSYKPVSLTELFAVDGHDYEVYEEMTDSYGDSHTNALLINGSNGGRAVYQLDGQYSNMMANLVAGEGTSSAANMTFAIFADDEIVYFVTGYTRQKGSQEINLDLTDVQKLVLQSSCSGDNWDGKMFLTEAVLEKNANALEPQKEYERLADNVVIDSNYMDMDDQLMQDSYGNLHDGRLQLGGYILGDAEQYVLFNINDNYKNFSGEIVTSQNTDSSMNATVKIYLDDVLIFQRDNIDKTIDAVPFSLNVENGKVIKIVAYDTNNAQDRYIYVVDDKLYFEKTDEIKTAEAVTLAGQNGQTSPVQNSIEVIDGNQTDSVDINATGDMTGKVGSEEGIHRYEVFLQNGTWEDAFDACITNGGHLVRINTQEEYDYIINELENLDCREYRFFIGGRRDLDGQQYFWADNANVLTGTDLGSADAWCSGNWMIGEPSFKDDTIKAEEHVMELFYYEKENRWVWNDVPNNLTDYIGEEAAGKVGYICEYDE